MLYNKTLYNHGGGGSSPQSPPAHINVNALTTHQLQEKRRESHRDNQLYALTTHQLQVERRESRRDNQVYAIHHTPATGGEERES